MKNPVYELKNQRAGFIKEAEDALAVKDMELYGSKMASVKELNAAIDAHEALLAEQNRFGETEPAENNVELSQNPDDIAARGTLGVLGSKAYSNEFYAALRNFAKKTDKHGSAQKLMNALTEGGGTPVGSDGGFLVPIDINTAIIEMMRNFTDLSTLTRIENVNTLSGWRAVELNKASTGFPLVNEMDKIPDSEQPKFRKLEYTVKKYGGVIPISSELLNDETANLMSYLVRWMARGAVLTRNREIVALLDLLTATAYDPIGGVDDLKTALNVTLDPDISARASILTNQSGFNFLDCLKDANGLGLLQPDPARLTGKVALGRTVIPVSNAVLPNVNNKAPIYVGDFAQYITLFVRQGFEMASTNVGGDAFETDTIQIRGLMRMDAQIVDSEAVTKLEVDLS